MVCQHELDSRHALRARRVEKALSSHQHALTDHLLFRWGWSLALLFACTASVAQCLVDIDDVLGASQLIESSKHCTGPCHERDSVQLWPSAEEATTMAASLQDPGSAKNIGDREEGEDQLQVEPARVTSCVFDSISGAFFLAEVGNYVNSAVSECEPNVDYEGVECTAIVTGIIANFGNAASMFSSVAEDCPLHLDSNDEAICAADVTSIVGAISEVVQSSVGFGLNCNGTYPVVVHRRLSDEPPNDVPFCVTDSLQAMANAGFVGLGSDAMAGDCVGSSDGQYELDCSSSTLGMLSSLISIASYVAAAANDCATSLSYSAMCTVDVTQMVADFASIAAAATNLKNSCGAVQRRIVSESRVKSGANVGGSGVHDASLASRRLRGGVNETLNAFIVT